MRIALHTPLKPLDSPVASGDLTMARLIARALAALGHKVSQPTRLVSWRPAPDAATDAALEAEGRREAERIAAAGGLDAFLTYHTYHKAPDLVGPAVAARLAVPYAIIEPSRAVRRAAGPWAARFASADRALLAADMLAPVHAGDEAGLAPLVPPERLMRFRPFLDAAPFMAHPVPQRDAGPVRLLAVGMMRPGDKLASYRVLAAALARLCAAADWQLTIAGDGPERGSVAALFDPARTRFTGAVASADLPALCAAADLLVWPAINEAYGMALLEAEAAGLPVVAGRRDGVEAIVAEGETALLAPEGDADGFAAALGALLADPARRRAMGRAARRHVAAHHDFGAGQRQLATLLARAAASRRRRNAADPAAPPPDGHQPRIRP